MKKSEEKMTFKQKIELLKTWLCGFIVLGLILFIIIMLAVAVHMQAQALENNHNFVKSQPAEVNEQVTSFPSPDDIEIGVVAPKMQEKIIKYFDVPLSKDIQDHIFALCKEYEIDPALVIAIIKTESNFAVSAVGDNGNSLGLMQIQPRWHQERMNSLGCNTDDLLDPYWNVAVGIDLLKDLYSTGNSTEWVLMAYNGGYGYAYDNISQGVVSYYATTVMNDSQNLVRG